MAANTQIGKTNNQTIGTTTNQEVTGANGKVATEATVQAEGVDTVNVNNVSPALVGLLTAMFILWSYLLWKLPSPDQIWRKNK